MHHSAIRHGQPARRRSEEIRASCGLFMRSNSTPAHEFRGGERIASRHRTPIFVFALNSQRLAAINTSAGNPHTTHSAAEDRNARSESAPLAGATLMR